MKRAGCDRAVVYRAELLDDLLVFKADYTTFQFSLHAHEDFALGLMEKGVQKFHCNGEDQYAHPGNLITVNAGEIHDGMSADGNSFHYRIIYLPHSLIQQVGYEMVGKKKKYRFRQPVTIDGEIGCRLAGVFSLMEEGEAILLRFSRFSIHFLVTCSPGTGQCRITDRIQATFPMR